MQFFKTAANIIKEILALFEKPLNSLVLNTMIKEDFLLDYINEQIKIINKNYYAKFPYNPDNTKTLTKGLQTLRIQIYNDNEKVNISKYIFTEDEEENKNSLTSDVNEINVTVNIMDENEIKKVLNQIAINIKNQPIKKYELQNFISSDNSKKVEKLNSFITTHVNKVARNTSNIKINLKVDLQIDNPTNFDKDIESNLINIKKSIIPSEFLKPQDETNQTTTWEKFKNDFKIDFDLKISNSKTNFDENKLKQLLEQGVKLPLVKEGNSYLIALTFLNAWIKFQGFNGIILEFESNVQYLQTIILGANPLALKYKINKTENKIVANIICDTPKSVKDKNNENTETEETDLDKIVKQFEEGIHTNTLSIKDHSQKQLIFSNMKQAKLIKKQK